MKVSCAKKKRPHPRLKSSTKGARARARSTGTSTYYLGLYKVYTPSVKKEDYQGKRID